MATSTTRLALTKPDTTDLVDISVLNTNFNKIDSAAGAFVCTSTTRPATPYSGQIIYETDTDQSFVWDSATSSWNTLAPGATICTSASRPASPVAGQTIYETDTKRTFVYASGAWAPVINQTAVSQFSPVVVADATARDALFPSPVAGNAVFRTDLGVAEIYYGLYNVSTNPGGRTPAGFYPVSPGATGKPYMMQTGTGTTNASNQITVTFAASRFSVAPRVYATIIDAALVSVPFVTSVSSSSFQMGSFSLGGARGANSFHWTAVQMTPLAANG